MSQKAVFAGTFDPVTSGHVELVRRASVRFDSITIAVAGSGSKSPTFSLEERIDLVQRSLADCANIEVKGFEGLLVKFAQAQNAGLILRGLRNSTDFEYELQLANMNRVLAPEIDTIFLTSAEGYSSISSSLVREIARLGGDVSPFVPDLVLQELNARFSGSRRK